MTPTAARKPTPKPDEPLQFSEIAQFDPSLRQLMTSSEREQAYELVPQVRGRCLRILSELPPFPIMATRILTVMEDPDAADLNELTRLVSQDPAIAAAILRVSNSAVYMRDQPIEGIRDAILRIGMNESARVVSALATRKLFTSDSDTDLGWDRQWKHSLISAFGAAWLASHRRMREADRAFVSGLLHDIGKLPPLRVLQAMLSDRTLAERPTDVVLAYVMEELHTEIGDMLAEHWQLPEFVRETITGHHRTAHDGDPPPPQVAVVAVMSHLSEMRSNPLHRGDLQFSMRHGATALSLTDRELRIALAELRTLATKVDELAGAANAAPANGSRRLAKSA